MKKYRLLLWITLCLLCFSVARSKAQNAENKNKKQSVVFEPTWESLTQHNIPDWFQDAKFGIYFHWGVYSVPAYGTEWYPHWMYVDTATVWGLPYYQHHKTTYGDVSVFGYKDFISQFKAEKFNPDAWAELFARAGARFAGPCAEHADGFAMWNSKLTKWNAANMGPKRDVVGEMEKAIRKQNLKFITTFHHQWLWGWYPTWDKKTDASNPAYNGVDGIYGPVVSSKADFAKPKPSIEFSRYWMNKVKEVIDNYKPDLIWFDSRTGTIDEQCRKDFLSYYYNQARTWNREVVMTYKGRDFQVGSGVLDLERGRMASITPSPWVNDDSMDWNSWGYIVGAEYKSEEYLVHELVDIVSKNGCLLLNIGPRADGTIPEAIQQRLIAMGDWLKINGEAIYGTRPFKIFGEGPSAVAKEGRVRESESKEIKYISEDIRFTTKGNTLYAISMVWAGKEITIKSLTKGNTMWPENIKDIKMLGSNKALKWIQNENGLTVQLPDVPPCKYAFTLKISGK
jgi:alpha-L-fucosidase